MTPGELDGRLAQKKEALVGLRERAAAGQTTDLYEFVTSIELLEQDIKDSEALADVRTLDGWAKEGKFRAVHSYAWGAGGTSRIVLEDGESPVADSLNHYRGATLDEARAKAAAWVRGLK